MISRNFWTFLTAYLIWLMQSSCDLHQKQRILWNMQYIIGLYVHQKFNSRKIWVHCQKNSQIFTLCLLNGNIFYLRLVSFGFDHDGFCYTPGCLNNPNACFKQKSLEIFSSDLSFLRGAKTNSDELRILQIALQLQQVVQGRRHVVHGLAQVLELLWI